MRKAVFGILMLFAFVLGCTNRVTQQELIDEAVELKVQQWRITQRQTCIDRAMTKAEAYVDSFMLVSSLTNRMDTIPKPEKPVKPVKPNFKEIPDSLKQDSILKK